MYTKKFAFFSFLTALLLLILVLYWPTARAFDSMPQEAATSLVLVGTAGLALTVTGLSILTRRWLTLLWLWPVLVIVVLIRLTHLGLIQFSGSGFDTEFFMHLEPQSFALAWQEHGRLFRRSIILIVLVLLSGALLAFRAPRFSPGLAIMLLLLGATGLVAGRHNLPEWELFRAWQHWHAPVTVTIDTAQLKRWQATNLVQTDLPTKNQLRATPPKMPKNLIILYLESIGVVLTEHPDWPDLMPGLKHLLDNHAFVDHVQATSYITIEGMTNSQCGTVFPFTRGVDSLVSGNGLAEHMVCLGDILSEAGYYQVYLGGAKHSFAGKGLFLKAHGYDEVYGEDEWIDLGFQMRPGIWGLSDTDLFEQSLVKLRELSQADRPFNLTLLTLGSHIPGYFYEGCRPYEAGDDSFLNAVHCSDQLLTQWVDNLKREGLLDDALLIITADHHIFPNPHMRELFGESVWDRRLPFIVIGEELPHTPAGEGGGYDLAPTVLDLLEIEHNARFALGRSLLEPSSDRSYYFLRGNDSYSGEHIENHPNRCSQEDNAAQPVQLPLDSCEKRDLLAVLDNLATAYSAPLTTISCHDSGGVAVRIPPQADEPLDFTVNRSRHAHRFNRNGYPMDPNSFGLYLVTFSEGGELATLEFKDPAKDGLEELLSAHISSQDARAALLIWRPNPTNSLQESLPMIGQLPGDTPGVWLLDFHEHAVLDQQIAETMHNAINYRLSRQDCQALFAN